jgi:hypothetical protein
MQPRVIAGVLALIALAIVLFLVLRGGDEQQPTDAAGTTAASGAQLNGPGTGGAGSGVGAPRPRVRVGAGTDTGTGTGTGTDDVKTYVTETGNLVRDHRKDVTDPKAVPAPLPPEQRTMSSVLTADIYRKLAPVVRGCGVDLEASAKGPEPVVNVTLEVDVTGEKLTATNAIAVATDISGPAADKVIACVRDRSAGLTVDAKGEPDRSNYVVQYPIRLR